VLKRYDSARRADVASRTFAIDMANRSLLSDFLPVQSLRAAGLHLIGGFGPLRRIAMREGLAPSWRRERRVSQSLRKHQPSGLNEPHYAGQRDDGREGSDQHGDGCGLDPGVVLPGDHEYVQGRRQ
jgi:hypothetical protein